MDDVSGWYGVHEAWIECKESDFRYRLPYGRYIARVQGWDIGGNYGVEEAVVVVDGGSPTVDKVELISGSEWPHPPLVVLK